jgi:hypothetical protein
MNVVESINNWGIARGTDKTPITKKLAVYCIVEELLEMLGLHKVMSKQSLKKLADTYAESMLADADMYNANSTEDDVIDALCDINVFTVNFMPRFGFDAQIAMEETVLEISSRLQDPKQAEKWDLYGNDGDKWMKWKEQPEHTLYKADYTKAKL